MAVFLVFLSLSVVHLLPSPTDAQGCLEGDIRLIDGLNASSGGVEICYNNTWATICKHAWSELDAYVACRQLGFIGYRSALIRSGGRSRENQLDFFRCRGNESRLRDCRFSRAYTSTCEKVGVSCLEACDRDSFMPRLVEGRSQYEGFIEVCTNNTLGRVCDRSWTGTDASVTCRQLGYSAFGAIPRRNTSFPSLNYRSATVFPVLLGDVVCDGSESQLLDCQHPGFGRLSCSITERVGVSCQPQGTEPMCTDGDVRLVNLDGTTSNTEITEGNLQFCYGSVWGVVCNANFDENAATVVCKELGIASVGTVAQSYVGTLPFVYEVLLLNRIGCTGDESRLAECSADPTGDTWDSDGNDLCHFKASVQCFPGVLVVEKLSGGEIFAILFCSFLFAGSIIILVLGLAYCKQRQYKKLVRTHSSDDSSSDTHPPTTSETAQGVEQVGVATPDESSPNQDPTHSASEASPPVYCESSEQYHTETDHPEQSLI